MPLSDLSLAGARWVGQAGGRPDRRRTPDERSGTDFTVIDTASWDVAIVGAGPAGSVCALSALAAWNRTRVALIDRETFPRDKPCGDAVRHDAASIVKALGAGAVFDGRPANRNIALASTGEFAWLESLMERSIAAGLSGEGEGESGGYHVVERKAFDGHLFERAIARGAGDWTGHALAEAEFDESAGLWTLVLKQRSGATAELRSRVLVGADGAGSRVRRIAGFERNGDGHTALALRAYARARGLASGTLRFDLLPSLMPGYGWAFPLLEDKVNIGVIIDKRDYRKHRRSLESYLDEYVRYLREDGVVIGPPGDLRTHPLPLASQSPPLAPGRHVALVGDAAAMINPMTGEGIHLGIWAGHALGSRIGRWVSEGGCLQAALAAWAGTCEARFGPETKAADNLRNWVRFLKFLRPVAPPPDGQSRREAAPERK